MSIPLTTEQLEIVNTAISRDDTPAEGVLVRVTSGAGTGKTTTMQALAKKLSKLGHTVLYLTFNKTAANDAAKKLGTFAKCKTLHSQAYSSLGLRVFGSPMTDSELNTFVLERCGEEIDAFLVRVPKGNANELKHYGNLQRQIAFYIRKTLVMFLHSSLCMERGFDHTQWNTTYYPAKKYHEDPQKRARGVPEIFGDFYTRNAKALYPLIRPNNDSGTSPLFDAVMKECQLQQASLPATAILLDESQDCNACQMDWITSQRAGKFIAVVGDAAQTIYSFRGARSKVLTSLANCVDLSLTKSFRFGPQIASVANTMLFSKEHSNQRDWRPYRITGGASTPGEIFCVGLNSKTPLTIIAYTNGALLDRAIELLSQEKGHLKLSVNGEGGSSGRRKWNSIFRNIKILFTCWENSKKGIKTKVNSLDDFKFEEEDMHFDEVKQLVIAREIGELGACIQIIETHKDRTPFVIEEFKINVIDRKIPPQDADIIFTTIHAAKGMEWNNVEVCDDLCTLHALTIEYETRDGGQQPRMGFVTANERDKWKPVPKFALKDFGDDLNLWYVAVTRAKKSLYLPPKFVELLDTFREIESCPDKVEMEEDYLTSEKLKNFSYEEVLLFKKSIVFPWKEEMKKQLQDSTLLSYLEGLHFFTNTTENDLFVDDGFSIPLEMIDAMVQDYLAKNTIIKKEQGNKKRFPDVNNTVIKKTKRIKEEKYTT